VVLRVDVAPDLYAWARKRSGISDEDLTNKFPKLEEWQSRQQKPTLKQLEKFAHTTRTPFGFFFLTEPPEERIPIPDFRTIGGTPVVQPSPDLLDTIYLCQQRQDWYRDYAQEYQLGPVPFVESLRIQMPTHEAAASITSELGFSIKQRGSTWTDALVYLRKQAVYAGVLVMINGVVGADTNRKLNPEEFRGFALVDSLAPVVFVNGADTKAAQIFTLAHEMAHIWLGKTALSDSNLGVNPTNKVEQWCNKVAAEVLVPSDSLREQFRPGTDLSIESNLNIELKRLANYFKTSTLVVLRRIHELDFLSWEDYRSAYQSELQRVIVPERTGSGGGNFYNNLLVKVSNPFARAVVTSTLEGRTLYTDAFRMLGIKKLSTFNRLSDHLGIK